jgi:glycosyltransferase involved in cell wall biosynthesis
MSCYNAEKYIAEAIDSILNQTYRDFEFIIWNDGSTDNTERIIKSYNDSRIRYFYHENTGLGKALNLACKEAKGEFIARMDADDISLPNRFEVELKYLDRHKEVALVSSAYNYIDENSTVFAISMPYTNRYLLRRLLRKGLGVLCHPSVMFRKNIYEIAGGYPALRSNQDAVLFPRMNKYAYMVNLSSVLLNYRINEGSISSQTQGNVYTKMLSSFRLKMMEDEHVLEEDVCLYNEISSRAKKYNALRVAKVNESRKQTPLYYRLYLFLKHIMGSNFARITVIEMKNILGLIRVI